MRKQNKVKLASSVLAVLAVLVIVAVMSVLAFMNQSENASKELKCVPDSCCHPTSCVPEGQQADCSGIACTQECRQGTLDCGQGVCEAVNGECKIKWTN